MRGDDGVLSVQFQNLATSLRALGSRRLWQLGIAGAIVMGAVGLAGYLASRPVYEALYTGLDPQDLARITGVLRETNISFDVAPDGGSLLVENGQASRARMVLAERGLPRSPNAGYEIFDKLGSLGLTSFMQELTRVRALEGELARSIQSMHGVRSARVHIALQDDGGFRRQKQAASASVVVRLSSSAEKSLAQAIRRLVSAATPGLAIESVTVLSAEGSVLAAGNETESPGGVLALNLEKTLSDSFRDNVRLALAPIVGPGNLNVSVALQLNTDKRQTTETIYNPESRVERSIRVTKENQTAQNSNGQAATSVERNIPPDKGKADGKVSNEENNKKEELTNYEISSKTVQTTAGAYSIERLSVAVLVNRKPLVAALGEKGEELVEKRLAELTELASIAVGLAKDRGDRIRVSAVEFAGSESDSGNASDTGLLAIAARQLGVIFNALAIVVVALVSGGVAYRYIGRAAAPVNALEPPAKDEVAGLPGPSTESAEIASEKKLVELGPNNRRRAQQRLETLVNSDEEQAVRVLKGWLSADA